ncbi:MAG: hypothetical protein ACREJU_09290, partial [Nitrospiraceae bacterium]
MASKREGVSDYNVCTWGSRASGIGFLYYKTVYGVVNRGGYGNPSVHTEEAGAGVMAESTRCSLFLSIRL